MALQIDKMNAEAARMSDLVESVLGDFYFKHPCIYSPLEVDPEYSLCFDDIDIVARTSAAILTIEENAVKAAWGKYGIDLSALTYNQLSVMKDYFQSIIEVID